MKKIKLALAVGLTTALVLGASLSASASVDMTFTWGGTLYQAGYTAQYINGSDAIGIYKFNTTGAGISNPFYSVCLSPNGLLDGATHTYDVLSFADAAPGIYPSAWAQSGGANPQYWGINNAAYLWNKYGMAVVTGNQNSAAAALEFAIWTSLYNSTGYGVAGAGPWFAPTGQMDPTTLGYYTGFMAGLNTSGITGPQFTGNILESTVAATGPNSGGSQEFFMLGTPVPEPTTMIAGALLLLPFGASTLRVLRKNRAA
jgi:hypothetical protein